MYIQADISQPLPKIEGDICIHCAGLATDTATYEELYNINVTGTKYVFEAVNAPVFIHISSASVYPLLIKKLKEEDASIHERLSDYGKTKLLAEQFLEIHHHQKDQTTILRPRAIYGTHDRVLLPRILRLMKRKVIIAPGDLKIRVSLTYVGNLVYAVEQAIQHQTLPFDIFNVSDEKVYELWAVIFALNKAVYGKTHKMYSLPVSFIRNLIRIAAYFHLNLPITQQALDYVTQSTVLDISKIKRVLKYREQYNFFEIPELIGNWVNKVSFEKVLKADKDLPWDSYDD